MRTKLIDIFNPITGHGIFHYLNGLGVPWADDNISNELDIEYHLNHSGDKPIAPVVRAFMHDGAVDETDKESLAKVIAAMFVEPWTHIYNAMKAEYNPIENYSMSEHEGYGENVIGHDHVVTDDDTTENVSTANHNETDYSVYGFNSTSAVDSDKTIINGTANSNRGNNRDIVADTNSSENKQSERSLTRSGNIGVTTSQQMLQSELDIRMYNMFLNRVFPDVDKVLTIDIY